MALKPNIVLQKNFQVVSQIFPGFMKDVKGRLLTKEDLCHKRRKEHFTMIASSLVRFLVGGMVCHDNLQIWTAPPNKNVIILANKALKWGKTAWLDGHPRNCSLELLHFLQVTSSICGKGSDIRN